MHIAQALDRGETKLHVRVRAGDVEQNRHRACSAVRAEHRHGRGLKSLTGCWVCSECFGNDTDGAFFVSLEKTLQREDLDLAIVSLQRLIDVGFATKSYEQRLCVLAPARAREPVNQSQQGSGC